MLRKRFYSISGQTTSLEHVVLFFLVIAAIVAMSTYFQRGMQARVYDARNVMITNVAKHADKTKMLKEYEPYYAHTISEISRESEIRNKLFDSGLGTSGSYRKEIDEETVVKSNNIQLPPECRNPERDADGNIIGKCATAQYN